MYRQGTFPYLFLFISAYFGFEISIQAVQKWVLVKNYPNSNSCMVKTTLRTFENKTKKTYEIDLVNN